MAKQSGLHQIKGKVEGYSYYRQSGVKEGLMRRINEGLSSRVKTSEEFANTRLNNSEFGNAADVAKVLASQIVPKYRPMFLNFSQAKLTKSLLALIKQATGDWGHRALDSGDVIAVCDAVNALAKNDFSAICADLASVAGQAVGQTDVKLSFTQDNATTLSSFGADGVAIKATSLSIYAGNYSASIRSYVKSFAYALGSNTEDKAVSELPDEMVYTLAAGAPAEPSTTRLDVVLVILMPYRTVNDKSYTLQEKCTFKMIASTIHEE